MSVAACGGKTYKYNEQVATPCGESIKRHTVPEISARPLEKSSSKVLCEWSNIVMVNLDLTENKRIISEKLRFINNSKRCAWLPRICHVSFLLVF